MKRIQLLLLPLLLLCSTITIHAQAPKRWTSTDLHDGLQKLNFLGSALYIAAHPDDENTRLIAYLANVKHANTAYLSLTRGDGGQNLVGPEISELLGVIRTQELLAARRTDGGKQFFSRANDFGFSKHPDETFNIWDKDQVLADAVWTIRKFQPDIIINRFNHRTPGTTHGHHTASAVLSVESFDLTADKTAFPEQLKTVQPWQPSRIFFNTSYFFYGSQEAFDKADKSNLLIFDVGTYLPKRGVSIPEIAATSRSQHKSQGFGSSGSRGEMMEYLEIVKGQMPAGATDPFAGINTTWTRLAGGEVVGKAVDAAIKNFDFGQPENSLPELLRIRKLITALPDSHWKQVKLPEINTLIEGVLGLFLEAVADETSASPGQSIVLKLEAINRSSAQVKLKSVQFSTQIRSQIGALDLLTNKGQQWKDTLQLPADMPLSNAYWLNETGSLGMYKVDEQLLRGLPETPPVLEARFELEVYNPTDKQWYNLTTTKPVIYKTTDPVKGELYSPFEVTPPAFVELSEKAYIFADAKPQEIVVKVIASKDNINGVLQLAHPAAWRVEPEMQTVTLNKKGQEANLKFTLYPPATGQEENYLTPMLSLDDVAYTKKRVVIDYEHIPKQTLVLDATAKLVRLDIKKEGQYVGYLMGAGDDIPRSLEQIGYQVTLLEDRDMNTERLKSFDAIILGVRAYNTVDRLSVYQPYLMEYVEQGGTLIVQYNTNRGLNVPMEEIGPYPFKISRDRTTVEEAEVRMLAPEHAVLNEPNKITAKDFEGWVQERGLYFPNEWAPEYTAILSCNDPGEKANDGGLLVAPYGQGHYVYTGYSWFRELPAGVSGAYRLFANLVSLGNKPKP